MLFNSYEFLFLLLPLTLLGYYAWTAHRWRMIWLTAVSYLFYGWWDWRFCGLLAFSTCFDYWCGGHLAAETDQARKRRWLVFSVVCNLSLLGFFKYYDLGAATVNRVGSLLGAQTPLIPLLKIVLPVGISFYTFQTMSYCIDLYLGTARRARSFWDFACYVSFFPQLVAGPIVRYHELAEQLVQRTHTAGKAAAGIVLIVLGLAKKLLLADGVAPLADQAFGVQGLGAIDAWLGITAYTMQIYFDFSAYSDMAVGLGLLFGFTFPQNFNSPYKATSITDFWRRWHISLSSWLRDYLYIPLGGSRLGPGRTYVNLFTTMLLGGLWHGASWTFLLWGGYHGMLLAVERVLGMRARPSGAAVPRRVCTFLLVMFGWLLFRCVNLEQVGWMLAGLVGANGPGTVGGDGLGALTLGVSCALAWWFPNTWEIRWRPTWPVMIGLGILFVLCVCVMLVNTSSPFLYFQF